MCFPHLDHAARPWRHLVIVIIVIITIIIITIITIIIVIIIITGRLDELCKHCLFNFHWLHAKLSAEPLAALLTDFADAIGYIKEEEKVRQVQLVADCLRLGGSILSSHPSMLGPQLTARLVPLLPSSPLIQSLVRQCDRNAGTVNCLVPAYHCLHTPGGPLRFSLEGHQFAVFGFRLTSDIRHLVSISNKIITFDLTTGDTSRTVYPSMVGLMLELDLCPNNKWVE